VSADEEFDAGLAQLQERLRREIDTAEAPHGTVLIIEDDPLPAKLLQAALNTAGWQVAIAGTAAEAESILTRAPVTAIVLDLVLPDADGRNVLLRLKEDPKRHSIPVFVASARSDPHVQAECLALGAEDFLSKPVKADQLLEAIAAHAADRSRSQLEPRDGIAGRLDLANAFSTARTANSIVGLIGAARQRLEPEPANQAWRDAALLPVGQTIARLLADRGIIARWDVDNLAVLFYDADVAEAHRILTVAREELTSAANSGIDFSAGITPVGKNAALEDVIEAAGHLLYLAQTSEGGPVICDPKQARPPTVKILLAEDDEVAAKLLVYRLTREPGFEVMHCGDGNDALKMAEEQRIDLAILDVTMPGIGGFDLLTRLREIPHYSKLPIAMLTALGSERDVVRGLELGADDYIVKPFSPTELIARVRRLLGRPAGAA
jgi:DNA-binding response OmpR family regulator